MVVGAYGCFIATFTIIPFISSISTWNISFVINSAPGLSVQGRTFIFLCSSSMVDFLWMIQFLMSLMSPIKSHVISLFSQPFSNAIRGL